MLPACAHSPAGWQSSGCIPRSCIPGIVLSPLQVLPLLPPHPPTGMHLCSLPGMETDAERLGNVPGGAPLWLQPTQGHLGHHRIVSKEPKGLCG